MEANVKRAALDVVIKGVGNVSIPYGGVYHGRYRAADNMVQSPRRIYNAFFGPHDINGNPMGSPNAGLDGADAQAMADALNAHERRPFIHHPDNTIEQLKTNGEIT